MPTSHVSLTFFISLLTLRWCLLAFKIWTLFHIPCRCVNWSSRWGLRLKPMSKFNLARWNMMEAANWLSFWSQIGLSKITIWRLREILRKALLPSDEHNKNSRLQALLITFKRQPMYYVVSCFLPTFMLGMLAYGTFYIDIADFNDRWLHGGKEKSIATRLHFLSLPTLYFYFDCLFLVSIVCMQTSVDVKYKCLWLPHTHTSYSVWGSQVTSIDIWNPLRSACR